MRFIGEAIAVHFEQKPVILKRAGVPHTFPPKSWPFWGIEPWRLSMRKIGNCSPALWRAI